MKSESCIDSNATTTFKPQKGSKDIAKTVHLTSVVQPYSYEALRIFLCWKKTKIMTLIDSFFCSVSDFYVHSWQYHEREELLNKLIIFVFFLHKKSQQIIMTLLCLKIFTIFIFLFLVFWKAAVKQQKHHKTSQKTSAHFYQI